MSDDEAFARRNVYVAFVNESTWAIRGYASTTAELAPLQAIGPGEITVVVDREPNLLTDKFCDPYTGEMSEEPIAVARQKLPSPRVIRGGANGNGVW